MLSDDLHISTAPTYKSYHSHASLTASLSLSTITPVLLSLPCHRVDISVECRYQCRYYLQLSPVSGCGPHRGSQHTGQQRYLLRYAARRARAAPRPAATRQ